MFEALLRLDPNAIILLLGIIGVLLFAVVGYAFYTGRIGGRSRYKRRLAALTGGARGKSTEKAGREVARRREVQDKLKQMEEGQRAKKSRRYVIRQDLAQAGLKYTVKQFVIASAVLAVVALGVLYLFLPGVIALLGAVAIGLGVPRIIVGFLKKRRVGKFIKAFPDALDVICRGVQSGLPIGECLTIIGNESPEPIAGEFREIVDGLKVGLDLEECLRRSLERTPIQDLSFFAIVLQIQQQTGGNLAETLTNLSTVLRDRAKMKNKVKAMAAEANTSAMIIGSLPFLITLALALVNPKYISVLFETTMGNIFIGIGLVWMSMGVIVMRQMIQFEI